MVINWLWNILFISIGESWESLTFWVVLIVIDIHLNRDEPGIGDITFSFCLFLFLIFWFWLCFPLLLQNMVALTEQPLKYWNLRIWQ